MQSLFTHSNALFSSTQVSFCLEHFSSVFPLRFYQPFRRSHLSHEHTPFFCCKISHSKSAFLVSPHITYPKRSSPSPPPSPRRSEGEVECTATTTTRNSSKEEGSPEGIDEMLCLALSCARLKVSKQILIQNFVCQFCFVCLDVFNTIT